MNNLQQLSSFLRHSADAAEHGTPSPALPPPAASLFARIGMTERLMRGAMMSPLLALAVAGLSFPTNAEAATKVEKPAIAQVAKPMKESQIMAKVAEFKPLDMPNACVINSLLFGEFMRETLPDVKTEQIDVQVTRKNRQTFGHRMVYFKAGKHDYVYDNTHGALQLSETYSEESKEGMLKDATRMVTCALDQTFPQNNIGDNPEYIDRTPVKDRISAVYENLSKTHHAAELSYGKERAVFFRDRDKVALFIQNGSFFVAGNKPTIPEANKIVAEGLLQSLFGGDGKFQVVRGAVEAPKPSKTIASGDVPAPEAPEMAEVSI